MPRVSLTDFATALPEQIVAGTTVKVRRSYADCPASAGWTLTLFLNGAETFSKAFSASGDSFEITLTAAETAGLTPGNYQFIEQASKSGEKFIPPGGSGVVAVMPDVTSATLLQTWEEKTLAVVEAALTGRLTSGQEEYQIHGRAVKFIPASELLALRGSLRRAVEQQRTPGLALPEIRVAFTGVNYER